MARVFWYVPVGALALGAYSDVTVRLAWYPVMATTIAVETINGERDGVTVRHELPQWGCS